MKGNLVVAETFYSIQGEGISAGQPAVFLRLAGCNLLCEGKGWRCDTIEVWTKGRAKNFADVLPAEYVKKLKQGAHLVITGGEPMMQQNSIIDYLYWFFNVYGWKPYVEIETNGTIFPSPTIDALVDQWNVSFKLHSSGAGTYEKRINEAALRWFNENPNAFFKIVISTQADILELVNDYQINYEKVYLMPAGDSQQSLSATRPVVVEACMEFGFSYSDRLHIVIWNQKTGV